MKQYSDSAVILMHKFLVYVILITQHIFFYHKIFSITFSKQIYHTQKLMLTLCIHERKNEKQKNSLKDVFKQQVHVYNATN